MVLEFISNLFEEVKNATCEIQELSKKTRNIPEKYRKKKLVDIDWSLFSSHHTLIHIVSQLLAGKFKEKMMCQK